MIKVAVGTKFEYEGEDYIVAEEGRVECAGCYFEIDTINCDVMPCACGIIKKVEHKVLTVGFKIVKNVLLYRVVTQDDGIEESSIIKIAAVPALDNNTLWLRGYNKDWDNHVDAIVLDTEKIATEKLVYFTTELSKLGKQVKVEHVDFTYYTYHIGEHND